MMHIMNNLSSVYDGPVENMEDKLDATLDPLTMSQLRDKISEKSEKIKRRKRYTVDISGSEDEEERALFAKTFKGRYRKCDGIYESKFFFELDIGKRTINPLEHRACKIRSGEEETDWWQLDLCGRDAEYASRYVDKGCRLMVTGSLQIDSWTD